MSDIIKLLPDSIANQIAAGEVVQRPASVAKELLENAIDSGAGKILMYFRDGGQTLVQVTDNGRGMTETDARMCWERHATSKISRAEDLFHISSFGFRGEALASIAAVSRVELKTKIREAELGTRIAIEASEIIAQEPAACAEGTTVIVKNLFYNIPARRNFLKSMAVETRHLIEEFQRVALAHPSIEFHLYNNDNEVYRLAPDSLIHRVEAVLGARQKGDLLHVSEETDILSVNGFIGSPDRSKKTRGDQFFFVNGRYIREPYFHHAVLSAFDGLIEKDHHPFYVLFLEMDPAKIDINVHPTKTEVKFEDGKAIYLILKSIAKKALSGYHSSGSETRLPFGDYNPSIPTEKMPSEPAVRTDRRFNPFEPAKTKGNLAQWEKLYGTFKYEEESSPMDVAARLPELFHTNRDTFGGDFFQFLNTYIVCTHDQKLFIIDQKPAHERVLYEHYMQSGLTRSIPSQQLLFPRTMELSATDFTLISDLLPEINLLGFDIHIFGKNTIIINGTPADIVKTEAKELIEGLLENYKQNQQELKLGKRENLARAMARNSSIREGQVLGQAEMKQLFNDLLSCEHPQHSPSGKAVFITFAREQLNDLLRK